jgi:hypothetical protein
VTDSLKRDDGRNEDAAVLSRRNVLAGLGCAGILAVAGSTLLTAGPAEALVNAPVMEPQVAGADPALVRVAERSVPEEKLADLDASELAEFTARRRRRYWRRRSWRRRYRRVVCRRRWYRGRLVRVCRRVW